MSSKQNDQTNGTDQELRDDLEGQVVDLAADTAELAQLRGEELGQSAETLRKFASDGRKDAQQALRDLGIEQDPQANANAAAGNAVGGRSDPYDRNKSLDERMRKHVAWGAGNDDSPYDDDSTSPSANAAGTGPATSGSFADFQANAAKNSDDVRDVRLVDDPSHGERVRVIDSREAGGIKQADSVGAERVEIVDLNEEPDRAVDADPIYVDEREGSTGTYESLNSRPDSAIVPVNPEKLERSRGIRHSGQ